FALGAYLVGGDYTPAIVGAGIMMVLLHLKAPMHAFVDNMGRRDMRAVIQFVVISLIILPLLPRKAGGPFHILNPFNIWLMVVLIVSISLAGYIAHKLLGQKAGVVWSAVLGGIISSTATTYSYARRTKEIPAAYSLGLIAILIASAVAYARVI